MSDIEITGEGEELYEGASPDPDEEPAKEVHAEDLDDDDEGPAQPAASSRQFVELPANHLTLVQAAHLLEKKRKEGGRNVIVKPQVLYSTAKNTKSFPVKIHTDGRRIVDKDEFLNWWDEKEAKKVAAAQSLAAKAEADENEADEAAVDVG